MHTAYSLKMVISFCKFHTWTFTVTFTYSLIYTYEQVSAHSHTNSVNWIEWTRENSTTFHARNNRGEMNGAVYLLSRRRYKYIYSYRNTGKRQQQWNKQRKFYNCVHTFRVHFGKWELMYQVYIVMRMTTFLSK